MIRLIRRKLVGFIRYQKLKFRNGHFEAGFSFYCGYGCFISTKNKIIVGNNFYMGNNCHLSANAKIGDDVLFASNVALVGGDHKIDNIDTPMRLAGRDELKEIRIANNVWIGHGAIIMHGVEIGTGAVVAAGAVVTKNIPENAIYGGNPARLIRYRNLNNSYETTDSRPEKG